MKILLINPPVSLEERYGKQIKSFGAVAEPMGLAYIAAYLEDKGFLVRILDLAAEGKINLDKFLKDNQFEIVGITMLTTTYSSAARVIKRLRKALPHALLVCGGPHPTVLPKETLREVPEIDVVCVGEGEITMLELASAVKNKNSFSSIKGIAYRKGKNVILTQARPFEKNIDNFPIPARHLLPLSRYKLTGSRTDKSRFCPTVILGRGCPYNCSFCFKVFGNSFRHHSVERIIEEVKLLVNKYKANQINFEADTISVDNKFILKLCEGLIKNKLNKKIRWTCESRVNTVDEELLRLMKEAGCWQISFGVESGSERLLKLINKNITLEQVKTSFSLTKKVGISIRAFFMLGLPTETKEESLKTIEFAKAIDPDWAQFTLTTPYPGTKLYEIAKKNGEIKSNSWDDFNTWGGWKNGKLPYVTSGRYEKELKDLQRFAMYSFYMRPKVFFRFLRGSLLSPGNLIKNIKGLLVLVRQRF